MVILKVCHKKDTPENISLLFIPAFGLFCYSFDAFFNFPQDRPEIQALFALFIGIIISINYLNSFDKTKPLQLSSENKSSFSQRFFTFPFTPFSQNDSRNSKRKLPLFSIILVFGLFMIFSIYILILNFNSLKLQHFVKDDIKRGKLTYPAAMFLNGFPSIPNLTTTASPIAVQKARYLLLENRNQEAIDMLKNDKSNPYDAIRLGLLSEATPKQTLSL